jgi:hypothetical protein
VGSNPTPSASGGFDCEVKQTAKTSFAWTIVGGIEIASFETMAVTPSIDGSPGGLWHGFITNGEIVVGCFNSA